MGAAKKALVVGAGLAGAAAVAARRQPGGQSGRGGDADVVTATVLRPLDEVTAAWAALQADDPGPGPVDVEFASAPGTRGTEVRVRIGPGAGGGPGNGAHAPGQSGHGGDGGGGGGGGHGPGLIARLRGETPVQQQRARLRRFKAAMEAGEVVTTEGQPSGRGPIQEAATRAVTRRLRAWGGR